MKREVIALSALLMCISPFVSLSAHHGTAAFDNEKKITLKGTVTEWFWSNPHCLLRFDVKGDDSQIVHWIGETQNPVTMVNGGWSKASFKVGDEVTVTLNPVKNGLPLGRILTAELPSGKTLDANAGIRGNVYK
ncbi:MAG TPA: DUF6152 family protein [Terriglobales bacterium]|jgi:hypothetical protein|nr:DUF6152 family protein [Terriglobales bacterium]